VLAVLPVAVVWGALLAVAVSVASVAVCSFFFLPPIYSFRVADSRDLVALVVFLVTAVVVGELGARLRRRARESARLARELSASRARIVAIADETRRRIGRDLHDGPQQGLVSLALELRAAQDAVAAALGDVRAVLSRAADRLARLLEELREISHGIHPAVLTQGGLAPALNALARRSSISVELHVGAEGRLPERVEVAAYYVVAELLTNVAKHAHASVVRVGVEPLDGALRVSVRDDGVGGADPSRGSGLVGLRDRARRLAARSASTAHLGLALRSTSSSRSRTGTGAVLVLNSTRSR
jgi:signal transduction histidine kinase